MFFHQGSNIESIDNVGYLDIIFVEGMTWDNRAKKARKNAYFNLIKIKKGRFVGVSNTIIHRQNFL